MDHLSNVIKKAAVLFHHKSQSEKLELYYEDEIIFCKNNVCVHLSSSKQTSIHNPGYLKLSLTYDKSKNEEFDNFMLQLTWTPNYVLRSCKNIEIDKGNSSVLNAFNSQELKFINEGSLDFAQLICYEEDKHERSDQEDKFMMSLDKLILLDVENSRKSECVEQNRNPDEIYKIYSKNMDNDITKFVQMNSFDVINKNNVNEMRTKNRSDWERKYLFDNSSISDIMHPSTNFSDKKRRLINRYRMSFSEETTDNKNLNDDFHKSGSDDMKTFSKFSVDLVEMKSIRVFLSEKDEKSGQLVVTSKQNQYKIFHFHYGGLDKLLHVLQNYSSSIFISVFIQDEEVSYKHFLVRREPIRFRSEFIKLSEAMWNSMMNESGQIENEILLRKIIFLGGLEKSMRKIVWPFLLNYYSYESTIKERTELKMVRNQKYKIVNKIKNDILNTSDDNVLRQLEYHIYKDVIRTDRSHIFYMGDENPNLKIMQNILLNYAVLYNDYGYSQGMSDLLAPILSEIQNEAETFWCFVCLMKRCLFICTPTDTDMERNLEYLRELIRFMHPTFFEYLNSQRNSLDLLFCHRWLLLCFKREFPFDMALRIWEACWSSYLTNYFHLFVSLAIITTHSEDVMRRKLNSDEMLFYFTSLAMQMDGSAILEKARDLLHSFRSFSEIPSTLNSLRQSYDSDTWDNSITSVLEYSCE